MDNALRSKTSGTYFHAFAIFITPPRVCKTFSMDLLDRPFAANWDTNAWTFLVEIAISDISPSAGMMWVRRWLFAALTVVCLSVGATLLSHSSTRRASVLPAFGLEVETRFTASR